MSTISCLVPVSLPNNVAIYSQDVFLWSHWSAWASNIVEHIHGFLKLSLHCMIPELLQDAHWVSGGNFVHMHRFLYELHVLS
jgi:hypothetical protein